MAIELAESSTKSTIVPPIHIIHVQSENFGFNVDIILIETNYDAWSQFIEMHIAGCKKLDYIIVDLPQPKSIDPS